MSVLEPLALGVMSGVGENPLPDFAKIRELGFPTCQLGNPPDSYLAGPQAALLADRFRRGVDETGIHVTAVFIMFHGHIWNIFGGPRTIGLVPARTRGERVVRAMRVSNCAGSVGI